MKYKKVSIFFKVFFVFIGLIMFYYEVVEPVYILDLSTKRRVVCTTIYSEWFRPSWSDISFFDGIPNKKYEKVRASCLIENQYVEFEVETDHQSYRPSRYNLGDSTKLNYKKGSPITVYWEKQDSKKGYFAVAQEDGLWGYKNFFFHLTILGVFISIVYILAEYVNWSSPRFKAVERLYDRWIK